MSPSFVTTADLDVETTRWLMRWMLERGVDGLFLTGCAGPLMTREARMKVFHAAKVVAALQV